VLTTPEQDLADAFVTLAETQRDGTETARYFLGPTELTGRIVSEAQADNSSGTWKVLLEFTGEGSRQWDALAARTVGRQLAIVLDGDVISAPTIQVAQFNGRAEISGGLGGFEESEARDLALALRYGSLPIQLTEETVQTVSATLGNDSLRAGVLTGVLGITLVAAYMIFLYRSLGIVVIAGLCVSAGLLWTLIAIVSETRGLALSLSGAVGLIVSVGVTVDSYVVYFEKLKDEIRSGRPIGSSVDRGFRRAWRTILAADFVSLLGAAILYLATTGSVRGFAFFLMMSTALDIFVAWFFTRPAVALLGTREFFTKGRLGVGGNLAITPAAVAMAQAASAAAAPRLRPGAGAGAPNAARSPGRIVPGASRAGGPSPGPNTPAPTRDASKDRS
jgi:preprotein translocase subunit SecD